MSALLEIIGLSKQYGRLAALSDLSFSLQQGQIVGLIGPNGAGKTTLIGLLSGAIAPTKGDIRYRGRSTLGMWPHRLGRLGIIRTFQLVEPFSHLSVRECTMLGALFGHADARSRSVSAARGEADAILEFVGLSHMADMPAEQLNIPERKRLEIARAVAARPVLLLLDEVMAGLSGGEVADAVRLIREIRDRGVTIIVIEHVMEAIRTVCDRIIVLHHGHKIADGSVADVLAQDSVVRDYLGTRVKGIAKTTSD